MLVAIATIGSLLASCGSPPIVKARQVFLHEDIDNNSAATLLDDSLSVHLYGIHAPGGWETQPIVLRFEERVSAPVREGVIKAASTWNNAIGFELLTFEGTAANFKGTLYGRLDDEISTVGVESHWCRTNKPNLVLGTAIWNNSKSDPTKLTSADLVLNDQYYIIGNSLELKSDGNREVVDAESLALHELGHLLGLTHTPSYAGGSVMSPNVFIGDGIVSRQLFELDVARVRFLYVPGTESPPMFPPPPPPPPYVPSEPYI